MGRPRLGLSTRPGQGMWAWKAQPLSPEEVRAALREGALEQRRQGGMFGDEMEQALGPEQGSVCGVRGAGPQPPPESQGPVRPPARRLLKA